MLGSMYDCEHHNTPLLCSFPPLSLVRSFVFRPDRCASFLCLSNGAVGKVLPVRRGSARLRDEVRKSRLRVVPLPSWQWERKRNPSRPVKPTPQRTLGQSFFYTRPLLSRYRPRGNRASRPRGGIFARRDGSTSSPVPGAHVGSCVAIAVAYWPEGVFSSVDS